MAFCTSCGMEVEPDQKFCEHCGALQEPAESIITYPQPTQQTPTALPPPTTPRESKNTLMIIGVVAVLAVVASIYFVGLPLIQGSGHSSATLPGVLSQPTTPVYRSTPVVTPSTTAISGSLTQDARYSEMYQTIYSKQRTFDYGATEVFTHDLKHPPLLIRFNVIPKMVTREKLVGIGTTQERMVTQTYADPNAWFEVKVIDADTGAVVDSQGFNKDYGVVTNQEFAERTMGNYRIEMAGNGVDASIQILTGIS